MKLDIGCGKNKREGFVGVDQYKMDGVDFVVDLSRAVWEFEEPPCEDAIRLEAVAPNKFTYKLPDNSVEEAHSSHFIEHLDATERVRFYNELFRVMKPGARAVIIVPHWASNRAYGDPTHKWPPVSEMSFYYLKHEWRKTQAPHTDREWNPQGYSCDFDATWGYSFAPELGSRNQEYVQFALQNYKEACQDTHITLIKPVPKVDD